MTGSTGGTESVYRIAPISELEAAFYRNAIIHFFVNRAIVELALVLPPRPAATTSRRS